MENLTTNKPMTADLMGSSNSMAKTYCNLIRNFFPESYGVYPPASNWVTIGAYGTFSNGTFQLLGQLSDYAPGIIYNPQNSNMTEKINKIEGNYTTLKWELKGGVKEPVPGFEDVANIQAGEDFNFSQANSLLFCGDAFYRTMIDPDPADFFAKVWPLLKGWNTDWIIVEEVYLCSNYVYIDSSSKNASFSVTGSASALFDFGEGNISAQLSIENGSNTDNELTGYNEPGVFGAGFIKYDHHKNGKIKQV